MTAFKKALSNLPFIGSLLFVVSLYIFEEFLFDFPQAKFFIFGIEFFSPVEVVLGYISSIASFAVCCLFVYIALGSSRLFQSLYVFLFGLSSLVQYGYWKAVERFIVAADLRIASATALDTWKGAIVLFFNWKFVLPLVGFIILLFLCSDRQGLKTSLLKFGSIFLFILILNFSYTFTNRTLNTGSSFSAFYQTITRFLIDNTLPSRREMINFQPGHTPRNNIVLVIDESIRGDHLSINGYPRETTPFLDSFIQTGNEIHNLGLAIAGASCSYPSNALILTGARPGVDEFEATFTYPTIFQYAKAMGYKTYYMDAQANSLWNGLNDRDLSFIDAWFKANDFGNDFNSDFRAAERIVKIVSEGSGNFIVLNKRGAHFLYKNDYPAEQAVWVPLPADDYAADPTFISNAYDNAILYNVNTFFERLLVNPKILETTTILYTSDHGQTLFEKHETWLHCKHTPIETIVPMILIGKNLASIDLQYQPSHSNILPTLLDLMNVSTDQRVHFYAPSLFTGTADMSTDHFFFDGSLRLFDFPDL